MKRTRWIALFWMVLCCGLSTLWGVSMLRSSPNMMIDFKGVFYDARCLLQHGDPYKEGEPLRVYQAEGGKLPQSSDDRLRQVLKLDVYLPTTNILIAPFAMLPWGPAHLLWMLLTAGGLILASFLMWNSAARYAPVLSGVLICFVLANCEAIFATGNTAGIVVSLCMVAVWCFLEEKIVWAGILCLAISLAIKPHDAGLVWLYFLLAGGVYRKRALQTLLVTAVLAVLAILWVAPIAPHWMQELHSNLLAVSAHGGLNDPGPANINSRGPTTIIDLQSTISVFWNDSRFYNPASYLICGALLLAWSVRTIRVRFSPARAWLALAAVVPLTILVTYHRPHDAKLLLLAVPACAMLWVEGRPIRWIALLVTVAGIVSTADIPLTILIFFTIALHISTAGISGQILTDVLMWPTPLILLAMGIFYLWIYLRHDPAGVANAEPGEPETTLPALTQASVDSHLEDVAGQYDSECRTIAGRMRG